MPLPKVSVIVPVYDAAKYLRECVDSILAQTFTDWELLLVDDGSQDASPAICDEYAAADQRIRVFHKPNEGVSKARNLALDQARGEWLIFVDADDYWCQRDALEELLRLAEELGTDLVRGEYKAVDDEQRVLYEPTINKAKSVLARTPIAADTFVTDAIQGEFFCFLCLIRKEAIGALRFDERLAFLEDVDFLCRLLMRQPLCLYVPFQFYAYRKVATSASSVPSTRNLADSFSMCERFERYAENAPSKGFRAYFGRRSVMMYYWTLGTIAGYHYDNRSSLVSSLGLKPLQRASCRRMWRYRVWNKAFLFIITPPLFGIALYRLRINVGQLLRRK